MCIRDRFIDASDYRLNSWKRSISSQAPMSTKNFSRNITIPSSGWTGTKYLIFRADALSQVVEGCENNNDAAYPITISNSANGGGINTRSLSFSAQKNGYETDLFWMVNFEQEVLNMSIEKSLDGIQFYKMFDKENEVVEAGNVEIFDEKDRLPKPGNNYYRVKFDLEDGTTAYTETKLVTFGKLESFDVIPNPASNFINVRMDRFKGKMVDVVLIDRFAREIERKRLKSVDKEWLQIDLSDEKFKDGLYVLSVIHKGRAVSKRIVITK